jgi:O-antigen ligase
MHADLDAEMHSLRRDGQTGTLDQLLNGALLGNRPLLRHAAIMIWQDSPLFGAGPWSLAYLAPLKLNSGYEPMLGVGTANAHCDPLQFLSEVGLFGLACICGMFGSLLVMARRKPQQTSALRFCSILGVIILIVYSLIDLPFRHPAIVCAWFAIAALLAARRPQTKESQSHA